MDGELRSGEELFAENFDLRGLRTFLPTGGARAIAGAHQRQRRFLGIGDKAVAVHGHAVLGRRNPSSRDSSALVPTLAMAMVSNAGFRAWKRPRSSPLAACSLARMSISLQPPPPGISPTPASTRPR